jgi:Flp pilus assembly pilin Flp
MHKLLNAFSANDNGATAVEYALIASLVAIAIVGGLTRISQTMIST